VEKENERGVFFCTLPLDIGVGLNTVIVSLRFSLKIPTLSLPPVGVV
jgi:hypothetical protein